MRAGPRRGWGAGAPGRHPGRRKGAASSLPCLGSLPTDGCPPAPSPRRPGVVPPQPRLTSPPPQCCGRERSPRSPPFPPPPSSPHPGEGRYNLWLQLYTSEKKVCRMSHTEKKKKNPKPSEKNLRVGLADGIIKASPEPRLALPLRQPPGEEPRPARPAPSPMDLRAGRSQASEAPAPAPAREPPDPVPVLPPGSPEPGPGRGAGRCPRLRGSGRGGGARAGRPREGPGGDAAFLESARRGREVAEARRAARATHRPGRRPPGARRGGVPGPRRTEPRAKVGRASPRKERVCGRRRRARRRRGPGEEAGGREGGSGESEAGPTGGEGRPTPRAAPLSLPGPPGGEGGKEGGREEGGGQSRAGLVRAGPRESRLPRCAPRGRSHHAARGGRAGGR